MAYPIPTVDEFLEKFPAFVNADELTIKNAIDFASDFVSQSWGAKDYRNGLLFCAAHFLTFLAAADETNPSSSNSNELDTSESYIRSVTIGDRTVTFGQRVTAINAQATSDFTSTNYGQMFIMIRKRNAGGPVVV